MNPIQQFVYSTVTTTSAAVTNVEIKVRNRVLVEPTLLVQEKRKYPVVGYRCWTSDVGPDGQRRLRGARIPVVWDISRTNKARCHKGSWEIEAVHDPASWPVPSPGCTCGFYLYSDFQRLWVNELPAHPYVVGAVVAWGGLVVHGLDDEAEGFRAEYARIIALLMPDAYQNALGVPFDFSNMRRITREIGEVNHIPVFDDLAAFKWSVAEFGDSVRG